jgi:exodeoxyribonuclease VII large subunit
MMRRQLLEARNRTQGLRGELLQHSPALAVQRSLARLGTLQQRLATNSRDRLSGLEHRLALLGRALHGVSPLATLERGYAIVMDTDGKALTDAAKVTTGAPISARLAKGRLEASVTKVIEE